MARLQLTISDEIGKELDELKKFEKGAFCELAIREALNNPNITSRFIWKSKKHVKPTDNGSIVEVKSSVSIDDEF